MSDDPQTPPGEVDRITAADAHAVLERLAGSGLMERGAVTVISVEAIRGRASDRWPRNRGNVWAYVERKCDEHLSAQDIRHRVSETDYLIAMTADVGIAAQAVSLKILEEVLIYFLGAAESADIRMSTVTAVAGDAILTAKVDVAKLTQARGRRAVADYVGEVDPQEARRRTPVSFVTAAGERVRIDFALEQVVHLRHGTVSALRVQPTPRFIATGALIPVRAFPQLADDDIAFIDRSTLEFGALFLPKDPGVDPPLIIPASFRTMGARKGRNALMCVAGASPDRIRQGAMVELVDVGPGTPTARLAEVSSLVSQLCRGVLARISPTREALAPFRDTRFQGLTFDTREFSVDEPRLSALLRQMALLARGKAPALIMQGLPDEGAMASLKDCGFTHGSFRTPSQTEERNAA